MKMPRTLSQLKSRLAQAMAESDDAEVVLQLIRDAVRTYEFEASDIFPGLPLLVQINDDPPDAAGRPKTNGGRRGAAKVPKAPYADADGNTWSGKGRRPNWLVEKLARGVSLDSFSTSKPTKSALQKVTLISSRKPKPVAPYADEEGNTWAGKGRRPNWLNAAIEAGAALEDFDTTGR
jgi:DNA-binding protein H-NS